MGDPHCQATLHVCRWACRSHRGCSTSHFDFSNESLTHVIGTRNGSNPGLGCRASYRGMAINPRNASLITHLGGIQPSLKYLQDAFILATVLGNPMTDGSNASIQRALKIFDLVRRPRALEVQERSRLNGQYFTLMYQDVDFSSLQGEELHTELVRLMEAVKQNWAWAWSTSPRDCYDEAIQLLESRP